MYPAGGIEVLCSCPQSKNRRAGIYPGAAACFNAQSKRNIHLRMLRVHKAHDRLAAENLLHMLQQLLARGEHLLLDEVGEAVACSR